MWNLLAAASTVKLSPLLALPPTVTTTFPVEDPTGTVATIDVSFQLTTEAGVPLNVTVLDPWDELKFDPVIVTDAPTNPEVGDSLVMLGVVVVTIVKLTPLLTRPPAVTTTFPDEAPDGTLVTIDESLQLTIGAVVPLNVTVPGVEPKFDPVIVTDAPTNPEFGDRLVMLGGDGGTIVKLTPLLTRPPAVTTTFPDEAPDGTLVTIDESVQLATEAVPANVTVPGVEPKFVPVIVTDAPTIPEDGDMLVMVGGGGGVTIVKLTPLLAVPPAVTTTFPDEARDGTLATIDVSAQLTTEAVVPLNVTVPVAEPKFVPEIVTDMPTTPEVGEMLVMVGVPQCPR